MKIVAIMDVKPDSEEAFLAGAAACIAASREEKGVLAYELWREAGGARRFVFNELYADQSALDDHMKTAHLRRFVAVMQEHCASRPTVLNVQAVEIDGGKGVGLPEASRDG